MTKLDPRIAKALSHPMRAQILGILDERVASPNEIAEMIDERLPNVSYHVRALLDLGCIELVDTAQRRGAIEHYYKAVVRPFFTDRDWKRLPRSGRQAISDVALKVVWEDVAAAMKADRLLLLTDVAGVKDADGAVLTQLSAADVRAMTAAGTISGGMIPKTATALDALAGGVRAVVILDGRAPHAVLLELFTSHGAGTLIRS